MAGFFGSFIDLLVYIVSNLNRLGSAGAGDYPTSDRSVNLNSTATTNLSVRPSYQILLIYKFSAYR